MQVWWQVIRPKTLLASIGPVCLATALAMHLSNVDTIIFAITLCCALLLQISVNIANDLFDGLSGVDNAHRAGPPRALHSGLLSVSGLQQGLAICVVLAVSCGCYLIYEGGWLFLVLGLCSVAGVFAYSAGPFPLASNALGEVAVFVFFGLVAVLGSFYLQTRTITFQALLYASSMGLLSAALMLVNNIRDIYSDKQAGKFTLAIRLGEQVSRYLYVLLLALALVIHCFASIQYTWVLVLPLMICVVALPQLIRAIHTYHAEQLNTLLALTARFGFIYATSTSLSLLYSV